MKQCTIADTIEYSFFSLEISIVKWEFYKITHQTNLEIKSRKRPRDYHIRAATLPALALEAAKREINQCI